MCGVEVRVGWECQCEVFLLTLQLDAVLPTNTQGSSRLFCPDQNMEHLVISVAHMASLRTSPSISLSTYSLVHLRAALRPRRRILMLDDGEIEKWGKSDIQTHPDARN